jgi:hypothetical protein
MVSLQHDFIEALRDRRNYILACFAPAKLGEFSELVMR